MRSANLTKLAVIVVTLLFGCTDTNTANLSQNLEEDPKTCCLEVINMADVTLTDTPGWTRMRVPNPGGPVRAAVSPGAVRPGYQTLADRTTAMLRGHHNPINIYSDAPPDVVIGALGWVGLKDNTGKWTAILHDASTTIDVQALTGGFTANTWYYIYAFENAGMIDFAASTVAPGPDLLYKSNGGSGYDEKYAFITMVYTDDGVQALAYTHIGRYYRFQSSTTSGAGNGNSILVGGTATMATNVAIGNSIPPFALLAELRFWYSGAGNEGTLRAGPDNGGSLLYLSIYTSSGQTASGIMEIPLYHSVAWRFVYLQTYFANTVSVWTNGFRY